MGHPRIHRRFSPHQVCEASDGSVWTLGYALDYRDSPDADKNALRHYSFEKGLLEGLVPLDSISKSQDATLNVNSVGRSFLRCGKDRVSIFFGAAAPYIEVDASNALIGTWATIFFSSLTWLLAQPKMCGTVARRPFQKPGGRL